MSEELLRRFYDHKGEFYVLVRVDGGLIVETPQDQEVRTGSESKESALYLFMNSDDAIRYSESCAQPTRVGKITLAGLWGLLDRLNNTSIKQFNAPVRVDVATLDKEAQPVRVDTLHSIFELPS